MRLGIALLAESYGFSIDSEALYVHLATTGGEHDRGGGIAVVEVRQGGADRGELLIEKLDFVAPESPPLPLLLGANQASSFLVTVLRPFRRLQAGLRDYSHRPPIEISAARKDEG
jgi:hypothetical protein